MPDIDFKVFTTQHFRVVYQEGTDSLALRAARVAEAVLPALEKDLLLTDRADIPCITIVLTDIDHESNGFSMPIGHRIELFAYPMVQKTTGSIQWIDRVVVHELAHQITYIGLRRGLGIYGELWRLIYIPTWFVEGIAQFEAEEWDRNREFLLRTCVSKGLLLDRDHLYGFMESNFIESRLLYEEGHSLYRLLADRQGRDVGGKILETIGLFNPGFNSALKAVTGRSEANLIQAWRQGVESEYKLETAGNRVSEYAEEVSGPISGIMEQVYQMKRAGNGLIFTGIERVDVFERNLYFYSRGKGLVKLDGPDVEPFFSLSEDKSRIFYSREIRTESGALRNRLFSVDLDGRVTELNEREGEEPCVLPGGRLAFVRFNTGLSGLYLCSASGGNMRRLALPDTVAQVYRPVYAKGRIWFSIMEMSGERKIASLAVDSGDYRIEVEKKGADVRYPAVNSRGDLAYISNEEGPFNIRVRTTGGEEHPVTADPYGVFAPDFDGNDDSVLFIALSDEKRNFNLSCFALPVSETRQGEAWDMNRPWKRISALDRRQVEGKIADQDLDMRPGGYRSLEQMKPLLFYPYCRGFDFNKWDFNKPGLKIEFGDPLEKQSLSAGAVYEIPNGKPGFELSYANHCFFPDLFLEASRDYTFSDSTAEGYFLRETKRVDLVAAGISVPVDLFYNPQVSQSVSLEAVREERQQTDSLFYHGAIGIWEFRPKTEIPLSITYSISSFTNYTGNYIHPLDAFMMGFQLSTASQAWGSDYHYTHGGILIKKSVELGKSTQTLFGRLSLTDKFSGEGTYFDVRSDDIPRGRDLLQEYPAERSASFTAEYRLPLVRDLGFSLLGLYFERTTCAPFFDFLGWNRPGLQWADARENLLMEKTFGIQLRQRVYFIGHYIADLGFFWAYDEKRPERHVFSFNISPGF